MQQFLDLIWVFIPGILVTLQDKIQFGIIILKKFFMCLFSNILSIVLLAWPTEYFWYTIVYSGLERVNKKLINILQKCFTKSWFNLKTEKGFIYLKDFTTNIWINKNLLIALKKCKKVCKYKMQPLQFF